MCLNVYGMNVKFKLKPINSITFIVGAALQYSVQQRAMHLMNVF